ncbi:MAG: DUF362 domain-containing protein [Spirochaetaceae bacterium]|jgi:uncharacterized protein (DUF362 family)|nr:DUF362 domain-containing protein [Spirochaetaceae bacterium]
MKQTVVALVKNQTYPDEKRIEEMLDEALHLAGGIESIVKEGAYVVIKGNLFAPYPPPVSLDRRLLAAFIRACKKAGAARVVFSEGVSIGTKLGRHTDTKAILELLGIRKAVEEAGGECLCLEETERVLAKVPRPISIGEVSYPKAYLDCDVLVDMCCLKTHTMAYVTLGIKNFQGILIDDEKYYAHRDDLEQKLVDVFKIRKPDLTIIDGLLAMEGDGAGEDGIAKIMNLIIAGRDVVAVDTVAVQCMGIEDPLDVAAIRIAAHDGIGTADRANIEVRGAGIDEVKQKFVLPSSFTKPHDRWVTGVSDNVEVHIGGACQQCYLMARGFIKALSMFRDKQFTLFVGVDPKFPGRFEGDIDGCIFLGDCACGTAGRLKEIRNRMLIESKGLLAPGCPPFRPAASMLEGYLFKRGLVDVEAMKAAGAAKTKKIFENYMKLDPSWSPGGSGS